MVSRFSVNVMTAMLCLSASANEIRGVIKDADTGEEIIGAVVTLKDNSSKKLSVGLTARLVSMLFRGVAPLSVHVWAIKPAR